MLIWNFRDNLSCILGQGGITIDMVCNSQTVKLLVYNVYKIQQAVNRKEEEYIDKANSKYMKWIKENL